MEKINMPGGRPDSLVCGLWTEVFLPFRKVFNRPECNYRMAVRKEKLLKPLESIFVSRLLSSTEENSRLPKFMATNALFKPLIGLISTTQTHIL